MTALLLWCQSHQTTMHTLAWVWFGGSMVACLVALATNRAERGWRNEQ